MEKLSKKIVSMLKSNAYDSVYVNTLAKLPIVVTREGTLNEIIGNKIPAIDLTQEEYFNELHLIFNDNYETEYNEEELLYLKTVLTWSLWNKCRVVNVNKFHYDETWYSHRYSVDYPEETFGILEITNLPFRPLNNLMNKKSFICRMDQLMFNGIMQPFMLFVNRKFVNWNSIDIVFDCDDTYLLLHGKEYNHYDLVDAEILMVILPFKTEYVGTESDEIWDKNYEMLKGFLQDSLYVDDNEKIQIEVPTMYSIYKKRGMVYNVGAWMYTQVYMDYLGLLSKDRTDKLKRIVLTRITYDNAGNVLSRYDTKFNALDKDSYDIKTYSEICHCNIEYLKQHAMFRFDDNGILDLENGNNILANLDESMTIVTEQHSESDILISHSNFNETLFRESFIVFKSGLFNPECVITSHGLNIFTIDNKEKADYTVMTFKPAMIENTIKHSDIFINREYFVNKILDHTVSDNKDSKTAELLSLANEELNYSYNDKMLYDDNFKHGFDTIMEYNPLLLNDLTKTTIKSTVISGKTANESLICTLGTEVRKGLKIPRYRYKDHETYVIIFVNGELIENYSEMYAASNYFFLPINNDFANGDVIEFLFFTYCDNNEIHFNITDNMIGKLNASEDPEFVKLELFKEYIRPEDIKIFADYPEEIMIYKDLIDKENDIAFNISYRDTNGNLLVFKNVVKNRSNNLTAVSSRKFIYERLYVDQKAYRIELDSRFKYCDNQKQYLLFINGRRMEDDSFFITVPKYSRPFWSTYLYTRRFVGPEDRIEIFYVPEELYNINTDETPATFGTDGYIETEKNYLNVPYDNDFYLYFINGKKIPYNDIIPIDSHTVRVKSDTKSLLRLNINPAYRTTHPAITSYMKDNTLSKYDYLINYIKDSFGYSELDNLFNTHVKMSDIEEDAIWRDVNRIAILNEIVRDFWVTSGYGYNEQPFVYDYELDEIIIKDNNGNYILPALDASPYINVLKNNIRLLYFNMNKETNAFEIGSTVSDFKFNWEFTSPIGFATITLVSQYVNGIQLDNDAREYMYPESISENTSFYFQFNTMQDTIDKQVDIKFCNGIYYGVIDEDLLQHYTNKRDYISLNKLIVIVPKDKRVPSSSELELQNESIEVLKKDNYIVYDITLLDYLGEGLVDVENELLAIYEDGSIHKDIIIAEDYLSLNKLIAGIAKNNRIPTSTELESQNESIEVLEKDNYIVEDMSFLESSGEELADIENELLATYGNNVSVRSLSPEEASKVINSINENGNKLDEYYNQSDLTRLMSNLNRVYQDTPTLKFESYIIGSNNYFVYACPKRLAYDENGRSMIHFTLPDVNDPDVIAHGYDNHTTPVYTNGKFDDQNLLVKLDKCDMEFMGEFEYTNPSGYTETYVMWKTNGFFTRKYDDYEFTMSIKTEEDFVDVEEIPVITSNNEKSVRIINTASPTGVNANDNIIFIDTLIL